MVGAPRRVPDGNHMVLDVDTLAHGCAPLPTGPLVGSMEEGGSKVDGKQPRRRSIRLEGYDYSDQGPYFIAICTSNRQPSFGNIVSHEMILNEIGDIVVEEWHRSAEVRPGLILDVFIVMPNHIHGIVILQNHHVEPAVGEHRRAPGYRPGDNEPGERAFTRKPRSLGSFIAGFKSATTKRINAYRGTPGTPVWQRNFFEHIIRSERSLDRVRNYIATNPALWDTDTENPANVHTNLGRL